MLPLIHFSSFEVVLLDFDWRNGFGTIFLGTDLLRLVDLDPFDLPIHNLVHKLLGIFLVLAIVDLTFVWLHHKALLRAGSVGQLVPRSSRLCRTLLYIGIFSDRVFHLHQSLSRRYFFLIIQVGSCFVIEVVLELVEESLSSFLGPLEVFHLLPDVFDREVQVVFFGFGLHYQCLRLVGYAFHGQLPIILNLHHRGRVVSLWSFFLYWLGYLFFWLLFLLLGAIVSLDLRFLMLLAL